MARSSIRINGTIRKGVLYIPPAMAEAKRRWISSQKDDTPITIEIKRPSVPKSKQQLGAMFGLLLKTAVIEMEHLGMDTSYVWKLDKPTGIRIDEDTLLDYLYNACPMRRDGEIITLSQMDMAEAAECYDKFCAYLSSQFGIVIPEPDPSYKLRKTK